MTAPILTVGPVARSLNGVIGRDNDLPWRLKSDLQMFKAATLGKPVIMGRKTWDSLPRKPLPGRLNIVLTRDHKFEAEGAVVCDTWSEAVQIGKEQAAEDGVEEICVIGGAALFELAMPRAKRIYVTEVQAEVQGDVHFPAFDENAWTEVRREEHPAGEGDDFPFVFRVLERK
ncbi:dihydrofolate reductase [Caulobacter endophyticus]|uniref:dihydrofolate reductase n=1 Tax=Caulobacter endophyticus TaxID=2172652 RepID=UPI00240F5AB0|nr:dihydrofolate reductase [Caulobacter endophyticus]MDG2529654.1 dihydrofolate reductase [Caulobacter endophyticus]